MVPLQKALQIAREQGFDLVQVASTTTPPVCRLLDYGRYRYEQIKKQRKARQGQKANILKEIRFRPRVNAHDIETKVNTARKLLEEGNKVRAFVVFRGREITHPELGLRILQKVADELKDIAGLDTTPSLEGNVMNLILSPLHTRQPKEAKAKEEV